MKRYAISFIRYLVFYALGFAVFFIFSYVTRAAHALLCEWLPETFTVYNPVTDREAYDRVEGILALAAATLSLYTVTHLAVVYDNERYEYTISATDGFYTLRDGLALYFPRYILPDILAATLIPCLPLGLTFITLPEDAPRWLERILDSVLDLIIIQESFINAFGFSLGIILLLLLSIAFRAPAAYFAVKRFRGVWLSDIEG